MRARVGRRTTQLKRLQDHALKHTHSQKKKKKREREKDQLCRSKMRSQRHSVCFHRLQWGRERDVTELSMSAERRTSTTRPLHTSTRAKHDARFTRPNEQVASGQVIGEEVRKEGTTTTTRGALLSVSLDNRNDTQTHFPGTAV